MITKTWVYVAALVCATTSSVVNAAPRIEYVELKPYTRHVVYIPPGGGTKFIFPFLIASKSSESRDYAPFSKLITNTAFLSPEVNQHASDLNSFTVYTPRDIRDGEHGNLFFNVAGYEISVELVSSTDRSKHVSDVYFKLGDKAREQLVQDIVAQRTRQLEEDYKQRRETMDAEIDKRALSRVGELALAGPTTTAVKEEGRGELKNGDRVAVYVSKMYTYGAYTVIPFEVSINSRTAGAKLQTAMLFSKNVENKTVQPVNAAMSMPNRVEPDAEAKGVMTLLTKELNPKDKLQLMVKIEDTNVQVEW
jgi:hypothetical protein